MNFLMIALASALSSASIMGIFVFIIKKYMGSMISLEFQKRLKTFDALLEMNKKTQDFSLDKQLGIIPEIHEVVYRLRNIIKEGLEKENAYDWDPTLRPLCAHLTENLYKYRIFLPENVFNSLHDYKHLAQDALLMIDISTRKDNVFDKVKYMSQVSDFKIRFENSETIFKIIDSSLKEKLRII